MNITADIAIHATEIIVIVFWAGVSYSDIKWLKAELASVKSMILQGFMRGAKE